MNYSSLLKNYWHSSIRSHRPMDKYYRHFKGGLYKFIGLAKDSESLEEMVVYQALYGEGQMWVRPAGMFFGKVERDGRVDN